MELKFNENPVRIPTRILYAFCLHFGFILAPFWLPFGSIFALKSDLLPRRVAHGPPGARQSHKVEKINAFFMHFRYKIYNCVPESYTNVKHNSKTIKDNETNSKQTSIKIVCIFSLVSFAPSPAAKRRVPKRWAAVPRR